MKRIAFIAEIKLLFGILPMEGDQSSRLLTNLPNRRIDGGHCDDEILRADIVFPGDGIAGDGIGS